MEGWEGELQVDRVVWGGGLDGVVFKDGFNGQRSGGESAICSRDSLE